MMPETLAMEVVLSLPHANAIDRVVAALKSEGFGVLTRIEIHDALQEKLGVEFRRYTILGACNPPLAYRALSASPEVGLLLPCNVTVEARSPDVSVVRLVNPLEMMRAGDMSQSDEVQAVAAEATGRLQRVATSLRERPAA